MRIIVDIKSQTLRLLQDQEEIVRYSISTAKLGAGEMEGSFKTPRGRHRIVEKIGADLPERAVFVSREFTGEIYSADLAAQHPTRDWVLTRILWLSGMQPGFNHGGNVDSQQRYIYIHGCPDTKPMGIPDSIGCIRMRNHEVIELFEKVTVGTEVIIVEDETQTSGEPVLRELTSEEITLLDKKEYTQLIRYTADGVIKSEQAYFYVMWDQWGKVIAFCRLQKEGVIDEVYLQAPTLLKPLLSAVIARATAFCWVSLRTNVAVDRVPSFTAVGFQPNGNIIEVNGKLYQPCRLVIYVSA